MAKPFAWSWSALSSFETCAYRHYLVKIIKAYAEATNPKMLEGQKFHKACELRLGRKKRLPDNMQQYEPIMHKLESAAVGGVLTTEKKIGLTRDLHECDYFAPDVWLRTVIDLQIDKGSRSLIVDYKTGKVKEGYDQLSLSAAVKFAITPETERVDTAYMWFEANQLDKETFVREDTAGIWENILPRVTKLERAIETGVFPKMPSGLCRGGRNGEVYCPCENCEFNSKFKG